MNETDPAQISRHFRFPSIVCFNMVVLENSSRSRLMMITAAVDLPFHRSPDAVAEPTCTVECRQTIAVSSTCDVHDEATAFSHHCLRPPCLLFTLACPLLSQQRTMKARKEVQARRLRLQEEKAARMVVRVLRKKQGQAILQVCIDRSTPCAAPVELEALRSHRTQTRH